VLGGTFGKESEQMPREGNIDAFHQPHLMKSPRVSPDRPSGDGQRFGNLAVRFPFSGAIAQELIDVYLGRRDLFH
jgi:hypothetical protein